VSWCPSQAVGAAQPKFIAIDLFLGQQAAPD
jgi:hypothetical protein